MATDTSTKIFLYLALPCEAKPLIEHYKLKKETGIHAFSIFQNNNITLTVTGIGKASMAAGIAYTQAQFHANNPPVMLNIGIAGHLNHPVGSVFLADKITDQDSGRRYFPPIIFSPPCPTYNLISCSKPEANYPREALCDMEASAFYEISTRFSTAEIIHCLKIVSDNGSTSIESVEPKMVTKLIEGQLTTIDRVLTELTKLASIAAEPELPELPSILNRYRFSVNEQYQLKKLLLRRQVTEGRSDVDIAAKTGPEFLVKLKEILDLNAFYL